MRRTTTGMATQIQISSKKPDVRHNGLGHRAMCRVFLGWAWLCLVVVSLSGCTRQTDLSYTQSESVAELPETHQAQIRQVLQEYFGTPSQPRLRQPSLEEYDEADSEEDQTDATTDESAAEATYVETYDAKHLAHGARVYQRRCASCHGVTGDGNGPAAAYLNPKPRDYRRGIFKFTSTPYGSKPRRQDLIRTVLRGAKGTSMPSFRWLPDDELQSVVSYVISLSQRGETEGLLTYEAEDYEADEELDPEYIEEYILGVADAWELADTQLVMPLTQMPVRTSDTIALGQAAFLNQGCSKCHGTDGRGHTQDNVGQDAWGNTVQAADITAGMLHGGRRPIDIYRRIYSGINGTPMPGFSGQFAEDPDTMWHLVHFVSAIAEGQELMVPEHSETDADAETMESAEDDVADSDADDPAEAAVDAAESGEADDTTEEDENVEAEDGESTEDDATQSVDADVNEDEPTATTDESGAADQDDGSDENTEQ